MLQFVYPVSCWYIPMEQPMLSHYPLIRQTNDEEELQCLWRAVRAVDAVAGKHLYYSSQCDCAPYLFSL